MSATFGARGDGVFNNRTAFEAADAAANGRQVLVPEGDYFISGSITLNAEFRFEGRIVQSATAGFNLQAGLRYSSYFAAFKDEQLAFEKALAALLSGADHDSLDLEGREVTLTKPVDVRIATGASSSSLRRVLRNGRLVASTQGSWPRIGIAVVGTYTPGESRLTSVSNIASIQPGMLLTGFGVGREVYATDVNAATGEVILSAPLVFGSGQGNYAFTRFSYLLDFAGMNFLSNFELSGMELDGSSVASCVLLPPTGFNLRFYDSWFIRPRDRGITSHGTGCFAMTIEHCEFVSREENLPNASRSTIAFNCNANDQRIRHNRGARFKHFCVLGGNNTMFHANHIYQGLDGDSTRDAGIIFTAHKVNASLTGNYIDNCWIEWSGDHAPSNTSSSVYGSMTIAGNLFFAANVPASFQFIQMRPYAVNQRLADISVTDNTVRVTGGSITQMEGVQPTGTIDKSTMKNIVFTGNVFDGVINQTKNPTRVNFTKPPSSPSTLWRVPVGLNAPFGGFAISADAVIPTSRIRTTGGVTEFSMPWTEGRTGTGQTSIDVNWDKSVIGSIALTARCDIID